MHIDFPLYFQLDICCFVNNEHGNTNYYFERKRKEMYEDKSLMFIWLHESW